MNLLKRIYKFLFIDHLFKLEFTDNSTGQNYIMLIREPHVVDAITTFQELAKGNSWQFRKCNKVATSESFIAFFKALFSVLFNVVTRLYKRVFKIEIK